LLWHWQPAQVLKVLLALLAPPVLLAPKVLPALPAPKVLLALPVPPATR
jgi:hypothetical protein